MSPSTEAPRARAAEPGASSGEKPGRKPRLALFIATCAGLGYIPWAPGTWGSIAGVLVYLLMLCALIFSFRLGWLFGTPVWMALAGAAFLLAISGVGLWASSRVAEFRAETDPQIIVVDELSGQLLACFLGSLGLTTSFYLRADWKYLLLGLILFRVFDIWKPFPARQAEKLCGGWGIMADDWIAGAYAAIGLWIARAAGL